MPTRIMLPEEELRKLYVEQRLSLRGVACCLGVTTPSVLTNMKHYGIATRDLSESHKGKRPPPNAGFRPGQKPHNYRDIPIEQVIRLYVIDKKSSVEIAHQFGVSHKAILARLHSAGVKVKGATFFNRGKVASPETREKLSRMRKGKRQPQLMTPEAREKSAQGVRAAHKVKKFGWAAVAERIKEQGGTDEELYLDHLLRAHKIAGYEREFVVWAGRARCKLDFAWPEEQLNVEVDGSSHARRRAHDEQRDARLQQKGWRTMRVTTRELLFEPSAVVQRIIRALGGNQ